MSCFKKRHLVFSFSKGSVSLFSSHNKEFISKPTVLIDSSIFPVEKKNKYFYDPECFIPSLNFAEHFKQTAIKAARSILILKALSGRTGDNPKKHCL